MDTSSDNIAAISDKPKRNYSPRRPKAPQPTPPMAPLPPNPHVLQMEAKISELAEARYAAQHAVSRANQQFQQAQHHLKYAQDEFQRLDSEVQYRLGLISQMKGGPAPQPAPYQPPTGFQGLVTQPYPPQQQQPYPPYQQSPAFAPAQPYPPYPAQFDPSMVPSYGVGAIPGNNVGLYPDLVGGPEGERTASAEEIRRDEIKLRGY